MPEPTVVVSTQGAVRTLALKRLRSMLVPVIAAVNGVAAGRRRSAHGPDPAGPGRRGADRCCDGTGQAPFQPAQPDAGADASADRRDPVDGSARTGHAAVFAEGASAFFTKRPAIFKDR